MEEIIKKLLVADNESIKKATAELKEKFKDPTTIPELCDIIVSSKDVQVRQYSAVILKKRFNKLRNWQMVPPDQQEIIKQGMLNALITEPEKPVRNAIAQFIGAIVRHEADKKTYWMSDLLKFIYAQCSSSDPKQSELGSSIFATLTDTAADQFVPHMESVCEMFTAALVTTEANGNMASPVILNILMGMSYLVPFIVGHNGAEQTLQKSVPLIIKALHAFAQQPDSDQFVNAFDIFESMADYTPKLLTMHLKYLLEFCLQVASNVQFDNVVRIRTIAFVGWLVRLKKKTIIKQKLVESIIDVVFTLMSSGTEDEDDEEYFLGDDTTTPMTSATQTMDLLALNVPPEKLIPPLLTLLEPALRGQDPLPRRAAYLSMAVIAEGCSEAICSKYLELMLNIIKVGITDSEPVVRNAAFFALGQFSEHLQPDISTFAPQILPILFEFLHQLCNELKNGATEPKHIDRMFYALETFCENLQDGLVPHLPILMERLFEALNPNNSARVRELTLSAISATANATKENMLPYFPQLIAMLQPYLMKTDNKDVLSMRPQAVDTLAALARTIGRENFMPLANDAMNFALGLLDEANDPDVRRAIYNLIASLANVVNEQLGTVYPKVMPRIFETVLSTEEVIPEFKTGEPIMSDVSDNDIDDENADDIDIENSSIADDDENFTGYNVENSYLDEKEEAILALKEFAEHTGISFIPYIKESYENVYKMVDHPQEDIRKVTIDTLVVFIIQQYKHNDMPGAASNINNIIPKLCHIINEDEEISVVLAGLEGVTDLLKELQLFALPTEEFRNKISNTITEVLTGKVACQFDESSNDSDSGDDGDDSEYHESVIEAASNLIAPFGHSMPPDVFNHYFNQLYPLVIGRMLKNKKHESNSYRSLAYGAIAECMSPLRKNSANYFDKLCPFLVDGVSDKFDEARQNAIYGLGELVYHSKDKSYDAYPTILNALSHAIAKETKAGVLDNICGAIARLILTNYLLIPLAQVLPVYIKNLPLREDIDENLIIFKSFRLLFAHSRDSISNYLEQIIAIAITVLYKKDYHEQETYDNAISLLRDIRHQYPDTFATVASSSPDMVVFLRTLEF